MTTGGVRIGELARRTGVSPELLRAWELRYRLLQPERSSGGFRLYSAEDERRVRRMTGLLAEGVSAAEAAAAALAGEVPDAHVPALDVVAADLRRALDTFDTAGAHAAFDRLLATVSVESAVVDVVIPYLRELGQRWVDGTATVAQEHFASHLLRGRLLGLARDWGGPTSRTALLAGLPGEEHDLGLIMFGLLLARRGWRVTFLGADTPFDTLTAATLELQPVALVLATTNRTLFRRSSEGIRALARDCAVYVAAPVDEAAVTALGAHPLAADVRSAADSLGAGTGLSA